MFTEVLAAIDKEIDKLVEVRRILSETGAIPTQLSKKGPVRPKGVQKKAAKPVVKGLRGPQTAEARLKIAAAQKKRWAEHRKATKTQGKKPAVSA